MMGCPVPCIKRHHDPACAQPAPVDGSRMPNGCDNLTQIKEACVILSQGLACPVIAPKASPGKESAWEPTSCRFW